jgi:hypothetical protein
MKRRTFLTSFGAIGLPFINTNVEEPKVSAYPKDMLDDPVRCLKYAEDILMAPFPEGEAVMAKDAQVAVWYAEKILEGPFLKAEATIAEDPEQACRYAKEVLKGRFAAGEKAIASNCHSAYDYARFIVKGRWQPGEHAIATGEGSRIGNATIALWYADEILKAPWPEAEPVLALDPWSASEYSQEILKKRFLLFEEDIRDQSKWVYKSETSTGPTFRQDVYDYLWHWELTESYILGDKWEEDKKKGLI